MPDKVWAPQRIPLGVYRGLRFGLVLDPSFSPEVYLEGEITRRDSLSRDHHGPRAILNALNWLANSYGNQCDSTPAGADHCRDPAPRLPGPARHTLRPRCYLTQLTSLRDQLKAGLAAPPTPQTTESQPTVPDESKPTVSELAEQINALKGANTIEATPQRAGQRRSTAEEPVTARIRRRAKAAPAPDHAIEPDAPATPTQAPAPHESTVIPMHQDGTNAATASPHASPVQNRPVTLKQPAQERLAMQRRRKAVQLSLF